MTTLRELAGQAASCTRCDLYQRATATVLGEGRARAAMALVGEQPGDQEDKQGRPFVGPAGHVLDRAAKLGVRGRSKMTKQELGEAIARKQD